MYVLVRYVGEEKKYVLPHTDVRNFSPHDIEDFDRSKVYSVFWEGDASTHVGFYEGNIIHITDTEQEMKQWRGRRKEARKCSMKMDAPPRKKARQQDEARGVAKKNAEKELLNSRRDEMGAEHSAAHKKIAGLESLVKELKSEVESLNQTVKDREGETRKLRLLNEDLQRALCSKILQNGDCSLTANEGSRNAVSCVAADELGWEGERAAESHYSAMPSRSLFTAPPVVPPAVSSPLAIAPPSVVPPSVAPPLAFTVPVIGEGPSSALQNTTAVPSALPITRAPRKAAQELDLTVGTINETEEVHIGHGLFIDAGMWERLLTLSNDSAFCKLAVRVWGNEVLSERAVSGTLSNNALSKGATKVFPPLSPTKVASIADSFWHFLKVKGCPEQDIHKRHKRLSRYLAQKCSDLRR